MSSLFPNLSRYLKPQTKNERENTPVSGGIKYFQYAFASIVLAMTWTELLTYLNRRRKLILASRGGDSHQLNTKFIVTLNCPEAAWLLTSIRNVLKDSLPLAEVILTSVDQKSVQEEESKQQNETEVDRARNLAVAELPSAEAVSQSMLLQYRVGIYFSENSKLKQASVAIIDANNNEKYGVASSVAVPPHLYLPSDFEEAFRRAWSQLFL
jgi:hypothetical protein